VSVAPEGEQQ